MIKRLRLHPPAIAAALLLPGPVAAEPVGWTVRPEWVRADMAFLAGDAIEGRGSATRDEAIAASFVGSQFQAFGLRPVPGFDGYQQRGTIVRFRLAGAPTLTVGGKAVATPTLLAAGDAGVSGRIAAFAGEDAAALPRADIVVATSPQASFRELFVAARKRGVKLLLLRESKGTADFGRALGGPRLPVFVEGGTAEPTIAVATLPAPALAAVARLDGHAATLVLPLERRRETTTNAIGYLPGTDPAAGTILVSAHIDHLGRLADGTVMHGANDDASGTTAVIELARALAAGPRPQRSVLFVCYGSEELGLLGSRWFAQHPPVPLAGLIANIEFEMIGAQDPQLPPGTLMMTGYDRSDLGETLRARGALVARDVHPDEHFFERSDNYALALRGIVAHTMSGWALTPTLHTPEDTLARIDFPFMTRTIQSLVEPVRWLANANYRPAWKPGGRPAE